MTKSMQTTEAPRMQARPLKADKIQPRVSLSTVLKPIVVVPVLRMVCTPVYLGLGVSGLDVVG